MKELDTLLERFVDAHESQLAGGAWPEFEILLQFEDDRLWRWLQYPDQHDAARFRPLLDKIRHGAAGAH